MSPVSSTGGAKPSKRGRKRKQDAEPEDADEAEKRKLQNRAAQRAFRERKERHVTDLEEDLERHRTVIQKQADLIQRLVYENQALRRGEQIPETPYDLSDYALPTRTSSTMNDGESPSTSPATGSTYPSESYQFSESSASTNELKPSFVTPSPLSTSISMSPPVVTAGNQLPNHASASAIQSNVLPAEPLPPRSQYRGSLDDLASYAVATSTSSIIMPHILPPQVQPLPVTPGALGEKSIDVRFDFETPFEYETLPNADLFQAYFDPSYFGTLPGVGSVSTAASSAVPDLTEDQSSVEDPDDPACDASTPPPLPGGKLPCGKPECDFSTVSCALPEPWRPSSLGAQISAKDVWGCQDAWAKLCSHPLFDECDIDELCQELRSRTRCSEDKLVILKSDVCQVFRSIPTRAKIRRALKKTTSSSLSNASMPIPSQ